MHYITCIIFFLCVARLRATGFWFDASHSEESAESKVALVDELVNSATSRAPKAPSPHGADLDSTTLGKSRYHVTSAGQRTLPTLPNSRSLRYGAPPGAHRESRWAAPRFSQLSTATGSTHTSVAAVAALDAPPQAVIQGRMRALTDDPELKNMFVDMEADMAAVVRKYLGDIPMPRTNQSQFATANEDLRWQVQAVAAWVLSMEAQGKTRAPLEDPTLKSVLHNMSREVMATVRTSFGNAKFQRKVRELLGETSVPRLQEMTHLLKAVVESQEVQEKMKALREDPELKGIFSEIAKVGPSALMKYYSDPGFLRKVRDGLGNAPAESLARAAKAVQAEEGATTLAGRENIDADRSQAAPTLWDIWPGALSMAQPRVALSFRKASRTDSQRTIAGLPLSVWLQQAVVMWATAALLGPALDGLHSANDVLHYAADSPAGPPWLLQVPWNDQVLLETCWWVPLAFGGAGVILGAAHPLLDRAWEEDPREPPGWVQVGLSIAAFIACYDVSGQLAHAVATRPSLAGQDLLTLELPLATISLAMFGIFERSRGGFLMMFLLATIGPLVEIGLINQLHLYEYTHPDIAGIPYWIPWVYAAGGPANGALGRQVLHELMIRRDKELDYTD